jgi:hypothetical protein
VRGSGRSPLRIRARSPAVLRREATCSSGPRGRLLFLFIPASCCSTSPAASGPDGLIRRGGDRLPRCALVLGPRGGARPLVHPDLRDARQGGSGALRPAPPPRDRGPSASCGTRCTWEPGSPWPVPPLLPLVAALGRRALPLRHAFSSWSTKSPSSAKPSAGLRAPEAAVGRWWRALKPPSSKPVGSRSKASASLVENTERDTKPWEKHSSRRRHKKRSDGPTSGERHS